MKSALEGFENKMKVQNKNTRKKCLTLGHIFDLTPLRRKPFEVFFGFYLK
jgi:hypothetical protein